jgi:hypothetical protein
VPIRFILNSESCSNNHCKGVNNRSGRSSGGLYIRMWNREIKPVKVGFS